MKKEKEILLDILNAFCLSTVNIEKVYKLSGIKGRLYNGKRSNDQLRRILIRAISNEKAKEIINKMPFPYIEKFYGNYIKEDRNKWEDILVPMGKKKGNRLECTTQDYVIFYK